MQNKPEFSDIDREMSRVGIRFMRVAVNRVFDEIEERYAEEAEGRNGEPQVAPVRRGRPPAVAAPPPETGKRVLSKAARDSISAAQRKRWAASRSVAKPAPPPKKKPTNATREQLLAFAGDHGGEINVTAFKQEHPHLQVMALGNLARHGVIRKIAPGVFRVV